MSPLSDRTIAHLRRIADEPDLGGSRYELRDMLGRGGMAAVYRAFDRELGRDVALKVLPLAATGDGDAAGRLRREAQILARLEHPGIVPVHDLGVLADGRIYYAMKRVEGEGLGEHLAAGGVRGEAERLRLFLRVCEAVAFAHDRGVVHRDLKPDNVMVGPFGEVLVMDWGVAKLIDDAARSGEGRRGRERPETEPGETAYGGGAGDRQASASPDGGTAHGTVLGTPGYMAPEQARGEIERQDRRADVYALGALLVFVLTGAPPPAGDGTVPATGAMPAPLAAVAARAMAGDPQRRYPDVGALIDEIAAYLAGLPVRAHREGAWGRLRRLARKYRLPLALILAYVVMRLIFLLLAGGSACDLRRIARACLSARRVGDSTRRSKGIGGGV